MKKLLSVLLALVMLVSVISVPAFAEGETLSVVYHYTDAETGTQTTKEVTDGVTVGGTFAVNFRAPNTSEKYFIGWYTNEDCTGAPVASFKTTIDGANHLYAGYKNYQSTITPYYANHDAWQTIGQSYMYFPMFAQNTYFANFAVGNTSYAKFIPATEEDGTPYWLRTGAKGTGSQALALMDEEGYAYQFRAGSTYKFTMKIKSIAGDGCELQVGFGKKPDDTKVSNSGEVIWNGDKHQLAKGTTIANQSKVASCTDWTEISAYVTTVGIAADAYELIAIRTSYVAAGDQIGVKDFVIEEVSAEYYVGETLINKTFPSNGTAASLDAPAAEYIPEGKFFGGWYLDKELTQPATSVTVNGTVKLYAKFVDPPKAIYYAGNTVVKEAALTMGGTYTPENFMLDSQYIPAGYYFTGWYTDEACTIPVKVADLTKEITVTGDFVRYAGLSEYEKEFSPVSYTSSTRPSNIEQIRYEIYALQYPIEHEIKDGETVTGTVFTNYIPSNGNNYSTEMTQDGDDTIYSYSTDALGVFVFHDENGKVFKAKPGAKYKISYEYKFNEGADDVTTYPCIGYSNISVNTGNYAIQGYRLSGSVNSSGPSGSNGAKMDRTKTTWEPYEATLATPTDLSTYAPFFYIRYNQKANTTVSIKNIKVEMIVAEVELNVGDEVTKYEINPGKFLPDFTPEAPEGKYFTGWYTDADCTVAMPAAGIDVAAGETKAIYAGFETYKTVTYYANGEAVNTVTGLKVGDTHPVAFDVTVPEGMYFSGWYTEDTFVNKAETLTIAGDVNLYAKFDYPLCVIYHYKDATGADVTRDGVVDGLAAGSKYAIDFVAPFNNEEYFVGWYLNSDYSGEQLDKEITLVDGVNNIYAKYQTYQQRVEAIVPSQGGAMADAYVYYPLMLYNYGYAKWVEAGRTWVKSVTYDAETNNTTFVSDNSNANYITFVTDKNRNYLAARPGATYKYTFEMKVQAGTADRYVRPGIGIPVKEDGSDFKRPGWTANSFNYNGDPSIYGDYQKLSKDGTGDEYVKYELYVTAPAEFPATAHNFLNLSFRATAAGNSIDIRNLVIEELSVEYYVGDTLVNKTFPAKGTVASLDAPAAEHIPQDKYFGGWYLDKELTQPATNVAVKGTVKLYAKLVDPPKAQYIAGDQIVKEETLTMGGTYTPESFMLDAQYIPAGYYFTGWYSDAECTQLVAEADLTKEITVNGDFARYAGLRKYEDAFNPVLAARKMSMPFVFDGGENAEDYYAPYLYSYSYHRFNIEEDYYKNETGGSGISFFLDENGVAYQADAGAVYKITFDYKYTNTNDSAKSILVGIGYKGFSVENIKNNKDRGFANIDSAHGDGYWSAFKKISLAANTATETEEWATATLTLSLGQDLTNVVPMFGIGNGYMTNVTYKIKNLKVEKAVAEVNVHVGETVTTTEVTPGSKFVPDTVPTAPDGMYFTGWYTDADCKDAMPEGGISVAAGETKDLYAGFETFKTVTYYANGEVVNTIGGLKIGDTHPVAFDVTAPTGKEFKGWFTEDTFVNKVETLTIAGDVSVYAKFTDPMSIVYNYKNKDGSAATRVVTEGLELNADVKIDFLAPNTNTQYFVGWYSDAECTQEITKTTIKVAVDDANNVYAKYVDYSKVMNLIVPGDGNTTSTANMPIITATGTVDRVVEYATKPRVATVFRGASTYDAETNTTTLNGDSGYNDYPAAFILTDTDGNFYAAQPGKTYKMTFEAKSSTGRVTAQLGFGAPSNAFERAWGAYQWFREPAYRDLLYKSNAVTFASDDFHTYSVTCTMPEDFADSNYNFIGIKFTYTGTTGDTYEIRNVVVEEYVAKAYVHVGETVTEIEASSANPFIPETPAAPEGKEFKGWYLDENFQNAMPEEGVVVSEDTHFYAKFGYPLSVVYNYLNADGTPAREAITEGVAIGTAFEINMLPANTADKYFVGWYTDAEFTGNPVRTIKPSVDDANNLYARYKEYPTSANVMFHASHSGAHYPATYLPTVSTADGKYYAMSKMVNYTINGVQSAEDELGAYNFVESNGVTMLFLTDADNLAYQVKPYTSYKITFEYRYGGNKEGDTYMTIGAFIGQSKTVGTKDTYSESIAWGGSFQPAKSSTSTIKVEDLENWNTDSLVIDGSEVSLENHYAVIGLRFESFANPERVQFKNIVIEEVESTGEYSEQIGGVVYEAGEVEDNESYAVTFNYTGAAADLGFFTADKESRGVYSNVSKVEGGKTVLKVNGDGTYTAYVTADMLSAQGTTLYIYAKDVRAAGEITEVVVTKLDNLIANEGASALAGSPAEQAIRYYFGYTTTTGKDIIIGGTSYEVVSRGFLLANGAGKVDDGVYVGATGVVNKFVKGDALANCWSAVDNKNGTYNIKFSSYVRGFEPDDERMLFVKGYITFKDANDREFTIYASATNASVQEILATYPQH